MGEKSKLGSINRAARREVYDQEPAPAPTGERTVVEPTPGPAAGPAAAPEPEPVVESGSGVHVMRDPRPVRSPLAATTRIGITIAPEDLRQARLAFMSDLDRLEDPPQSLARWMIRAISRHLEREPVARWAAAKASPGTGSTTRKTPYNATVPVGMPEALAAAVKEERAAGRSTNASALVREALAIEVDAARTRAGGVLPLVVGPLPHAR